MQTVKHRVNRALNYPEINKLELATLKTLERLLKKKNIHFPYLGKLIENNLDPLFMTVLSFAVEGDYWMSLRKNRENPINIYFGRGSVRDAVRKLALAVALKNPRGMLSALLSIGITRNMLHAPFSDRGSLPHLFVILAMAHYLGYTVFWQSPDAEKVVRSK